MPKREADAAHPVRAPSRDADPLVGKRLAHYEILARLGHGSMGVVYKARNVNLDRVVALKVLPDSLAQGDQTCVHRFVQEARAAAALKQAHVVTVHHIGQAGGKLFIEMEYVDGGTLGKALERLGRLGPSVAARVVRDCAEALAAAHAKGIIHRDVKPENILLEMREESGGAARSPGGGDVGMTAKLCDFGVALLRESGRRLTENGATFGSRYYISPEQIQGKTADARSDIYSLGCVFYELVTGRTPFDAESAEGVLFKHVRENPPPLRQAAPHVARPISDIIERMMAKNPEERFQSAADLVRQIDSALEGKSMTPAQAEGALTRPVGRRWGLPAAGVVLGVALICFGVYAWRSDRWAGKAPKAGQALSSRHVATAGTGEGIPHPLSAATSVIQCEGKTVRVPEGMVHVPAGTFWMGRSHGGKDTGFLSKEVWVDAYFIGKYEVTNAEYAEFVKAAAHRKPPYWQGGSVPQGKENHPVVNVSWHDAAAYCQWLSAKTGRAVRLPTEAEWEKAAAWEPIKKHANLYVWGDAWDAGKCNNAYALGYKDTMNWAQWWAEWSASEHGRGIVGRGGNTTPVGAFKGDVSANGCYDMASNVWEWVADWYQEDYYRGGPNKNPAGPAAGQRRVMRGGMWREVASTLICSYRHALEPNDTSYCYGFRCAQTP